MLDEREEDAQDDAEDESRLTCLEDLSKFWSHLDSYSRPNASALETAQDRTPRSTCNLANGSSFFFRLFSHASRTTQPAQRVAFLLLWKWYVEISR